MLLFLAGWSRSNLLNDFVLHMHMCDVNREIINSSWGSLFQAEGNLFEILRAPNCKDVCFFSRLGQCRAALITLSDRDEKRVGAAALCDGLKQALEIRQFTAHFYVSSQRCY